MSDSMFHELHIPSPIVQVGTKEPDTNCARDDGGQRADIVLEHWCLLSKRFDVSNEF